MMHSSSSSSSSSFITSSSPVTQNSASLSLAQRHAFTVCGPYSRQSLFTASDVTAARHTGRSEVAQGDLGDSTAASVLIIRSWYTGLVHLVQSGAYVRQALVAIPNVRKASVPIVLLLCRGEGHAIRTVRWDMTPLPPSLPQITALLCEHGLECGSVPDFKSSPGG